MDVLEIVGGALLILASIILIIVVILQESKQSGLSSMNGMSDSYLSKNRGKSIDAKLAFITKVVAFIFFAITLTLNLIIAHVK